MKRNNRLMRTFVLTILWFGGILITQASAFAQNSSTQKPSFQINITGPQTLKSGTDLIVEATLTNNSNQSVSIWVESGAGIPLGAEVRQGADNKIASQTRLGLILAGKIDPSDLTPRELFNQILHSGGKSVLKPGVSLKEEYNVSKLYDLTNPGSYTVQLLLTDALSRIKDESRAEEVNGKVVSDLEELIRGTLKSNIITVTVTP